MRIRVKNAEEQKDDEKKKEVSKNKEVEKEVKKTVDIFVESKKMGNGKESKEEINGDCSDDEDSSEGETSDSGSITFGNDAGKNISTPPPCAGIKEEQNAPYHCVSSNNTSASTTAKELKSVSIKSVVSSIDVESPILNTTTAVNEKKKELEKKTDKKTDDTLKAKVYEAENNDNDIKNESDIDESYTSRSCSSQSPGPSVLSSTSPSPSPGLLEKKNIPFSGETNEASSSLTAISCSSVGCLSPNVSSSQNFSVHPVSIMVRTSPIIDYTLRDTDKMFVYQTISFSKFPPSIIEWYSPKYDVENEKVSKPPPSELLNRFIIREEQSKIIMERVRSIPSGELNDEETNTQDENVMSEEMKSKLEGKEYAYPVSFVYSLAKTPSLKHPPDTFQLDEETKMAFSNQSNPQPKQQKKKNYFKLKNTSKQNIQNHSNKYYSPFLTSPQLKRAENAWNPKQQQNQSPQQQQQQRFYQPHKDLPCLLLLQNVENMEDDEKKKEVSKNKEVEKVESKKMGNGKESKEEIDSDCSDDEDSSEGETSDSGSITFGNDFGKNISTPKPLTKFQPKKLEKEKEKSKAAAGGGGGVAGVVAGGSGGLTLTQHSFAQLEPPSNVENLFLLSDPKHPKLPRYTVDLINVVCDIVLHPENKKNQSFFSSAIKMATVGKPIKSLSEKEKDGTRNENNEGEDKTLITLSSAYRFTVVAVIGECVKLCSSVVVEDAQEDVSSLCNEKMDTVVNNFLKCIVLFSFGSACAFIEALVYVILEINELHKLISANANDSQIVVDPSISQKAVKDAKFSLITKRLKVFDDTHRNRVEIPIATENSSGLSLLPCIQSKLVLNKRFLQSLKKLASSLVGVMLADGGFIYLFL
jgi:hypothetical protein